MLGLASEAAAPNLGLFVLVGLVFFLVFVPVLLLLLLPTWQSKRAGRSGWWIYLVAFVVPFLNLAVVLAWFAWLKRHPFRFPKWVFGAWDVVI